MQITTTARPGQLEVKLIGRMDAGWSDHVAQALENCLQSGQHAIGVDMTQVDYLSSAGIRILVLYARKLKLIQGSFAVVNASPAVRRVLELSGLEKLLLSAAAAPVAAPRTKAARTISFAEADTTAELFELQSDAVLRVQWPGDAQPWFEGTGLSQDCTAIDFPSAAVGLGLGGFGADSAQEPVRLGEFLAAAGAVVCLPADGANHPDYMLQEEALTPNLKVAYGMVGSGAWRQLLRFDKGNQILGVSLSALVKACLEANGGQPVGIVMVAETASLTGASLQKLPSGLSPAEGRASIFRFPHVRDFLSFTTEPALLNTLSLVVGYAGRSAAASSLRLAKPLTPSGDVLGHFHAAAFPYQPLRRGQVELKPTVRALFQNGQVLGLLHLLNDWRQINGAGESRFLRGACWCAPLAD